MKLQYKKVGDTFTQEEYNAICYLLTTDSWTETVPLKIGEKYYGKYATYELKDPNQILGETREGYAIVKNIKNATLEQRQLKLVIFHDNMHSTFKATFKTSTRLEVLHAGQPDTPVLTDTYASKNDFVDDMERDSNVYQEKETPIEINTTELGTIESTDLSDITTVVYLDPAQFDMQKGDYLYGQADITIAYDKPILNATDGAVNYEDEIICEDYKTLKEVILSAPEESTTKIRLLGKEYKFENQIHIRNKNIVIRGGKVTVGYKPYTVLDAQGLARHFIVGSKSSLDISYCRLINGDVYGEEGRKVLHNYGGSIHVSSGVELKNEAFHINMGKLRVNYCWFEHNRAEQGGAICNYNGNTQIKNTKFLANKVMSEDRSTSTNTYHYTTSNFGGAILNLSHYGKYHNDPSDRIKVDYAKYMSNTQLKIYFDKLQNSLILSRVPPTKDNIRVYNYTDKTFINISSLSIEAQTTIPEYGDVLTLNYTPSQSLLNKNLYIIFDGNSAIPSTRSTLFKVGA